VNKRHGRNLLVLVERIQDFWGVQKQVNKRMPGASNGEAILLISSSV
jgi:hypothetical protein